MSEAEDSEGSDSYLSAESPMSCDEDEDGYRTPTDKVVDEEQNVVDIHKRRNRHKRTFSGDRITSIEENLLDVKEKLHTVHSEICHMRNDMNCLRQSGRTRYKTERSTSAPAGVTTRTQNSKEDLSDIRSLLPAANQQSEASRKLKKLCSKLKKMHPEVESVWAGYEKMQHFEPKLVVHLKEDADLKNIPKRYETYDVIVRGKGQISDEAEKVEAERFNNALSDKDFERLNACISRNAKQLMNAYSNLEMISCSRVKSSKYGQRGAKIDNKPCIVMYVKVKGIIPIFEESFPDIVEGIVVDVREGYFRPYSDPEAKRHYGNLVMGCQIETFTRAAGTVGGFVRLKDDSVGLITCCHVVLDDNSINDLKLDSLAFNQRLSRFQIDVFQPSPDIAEHHIGYVAMAVHKEGSETESGVDAALIKISEEERYPVAGVFPKAVSQECGYSKERPMVFKSGKVIPTITKDTRRCQVLKYGITTGHTHGILRLKNTAVRHTYFTSFTKRSSYCLFKQLEINPGFGKPFADFGDSGALVFMSVNGQDEDIRAIGLLVGGTTYGTAIASPIWSVLNALDLRHDFLQFPLKTVETSVSQAAVNADTRSEVLDKRVETLENKVNKVDKQVEDLDAKLDTKVSELETKIVHGSAEIKAKMEVGFEEVLKRLPIKE